MARTESLQEMLTELSHMIENVEDEQLKADMQSKMSDIDDQMSNLNDIKHRIEKCYDELSTLTY